MVKWENIFFCFVLKFLFVDLLNRLDHIFVLIATNLMAWSGTFTSTLQNETIDWFVVTISLINTHTHIYIHSNLKNTISLHLNFTYKLKDITRAYHYYLTPISLCRLFRLRHSHTFSSNPKPWRRYHSCCFFLPRCLNWRYGPYEYHGDDSVNNPYSCLICKQWRVPGVVDDQRLYRFPGSLLIADLCWKM